MTISEQFENGSIYTVKDTMCSEQVGYNAHPKFKGVSLKHLVAGGITNGLLSCHLVKVEPQCTLDTHTHAESFEIHEVISGSGTLYMGGTEHPYTAGCVGVIPAGTEHKVQASEEGLYILATFTPPLV